MQYVKNSCKKFFKSKYAKAHLASFVLLIVVVVFFIYFAPVSLAQNAQQAQEAERTFWDKINPLNLIPLAIGIILQLLINLVGTLLGVVIEILFKYVIFYNDFIYTSIVMTGWAIVRDLANMFFVLILLFVAIATILSIENYSLKRFLPKIVLMAILINFSKLIAGVIIDFAQIVTWTFASVITETGVQNIYFSFGIMKLFVVQQSSVLPTAIYDWQIVAGIALGFILLLIAFLIILVYMVILVLRIVALWILVILSPLAYLLNAWPGQYLGKYAHQWWEEFIKYVVIAPVLMFFLWLALIAAGTDIQLNVPSNNPNAPTAGITQIADMPSLIRFIVTACLLIVGLSAAQKSGVAGAGFAGTAMSRMKRTAQWAGRKFTGYGYVADRVKTYMDIRKARKREGIISDARAIEKGIAWTQRAAKTAVSAPFKYGAKIPLGKKVTVGKVATAAWDRSVNYFGGRARRSKDNAEKAKTAAQKLRDEASDLQKKEVPKLPPATPASSIPEYQSLQINHEEKKKEMEEVEKDTRIHDDDRKRIIADKQKELDDIKGKMKSYEDTEKTINEVIGVQNEEAKEKRDKEVRGKLSQAEQKDKEAAEENKKALSYTKKQKWINKGIHAGIGGVLGYGLPIPMVGAAVGSVVGGIGISRVAKNIKEAGKGEGESVNTYEAGQVSEERTKIKDLSNLEITAQLDDPTKDKYQRAALAMEALSRKLIASLTDAKSRRDRLETEFRGNKKVIAQMESILEKNYPGATRMFADASIDLDEVKKTHKEGTKEYTREKEKKERAQRDLRDEYNRGDRTLRDTDRDTLDKTPELWAPGIKSTAFVRQYEGLEDEQKKNIIKFSLDEYVRKLEELIGKLPDGDEKEKYKNDLQQSREKLAGITSIDKAYGKIPAVPTTPEQKLAQEQRDKYISDLNVEQIRKILREGDNPKIEALIRAVEGKKDKLSVAVRRAIDTWSGTGPQIAKALKIKGVGKKKKGGEEEEGEEEEEEEPTTT